MSSESPVFLISPAATSGVRAAMLLHEGARFELAVRLREEGAPVGEVFAFLSGLYFRGKLAYARRFGPESSRVITSCAGLLAPETLVRRRDLLRFARVPIASAESATGDPSRVTRGSSRAASPGTRRSCCWVRSRPTSTAGCCSRSSARGCASRPSSWDAGT